MEFVHPSVAAMNQDIPSLNPERFRLFSVIETGVIESGQVTRLGAQPGRVHVLQVHQAYFLRDLGIVTSSANYSGLRLNQPPWVRQKWLH